MNDDDTTQPRTAQPAPMPVTEGAFESQAVLVLRAAVDNNQIHALVQYDSTVFVENPANPQGDAIPDMNNVAVFFARWIEMHAKELMSMAMVEYLLNQRIAAMSAQAAAKAPAVHLLSADGTSRLN